VEVRPLDDRPLDEPRADRLDRAHPQAAAALAAHAAALAEGAATYRDPITGYRVLTARTLAERGACCDLGCRHCPYAPKD
jgi:hypothetical protein